MEGACGNRAGVRGRLFLRFATGVPDRGGAAMTLEFIVVSGRAVVGSSFDFLMAGFNKDENGEGFSILSLSLSLFRLLLLLLLFDLVSSSLSLSSFPFSSSSDEARCRLLVSEVDDATTRI